MFVLKLSSIQNHFQGLKNLLEIMEKCYSKTLLKSERLNTKVKV